MIDVAIVRDWIILEKAWYRGKDAREKLSVPLRGFPRVTGRGRYRRPSIPSEWSTTLAEKYTPRLRCVPTLLSSIEMQPRASTLCDNAHYLS